jgi:hypothetical protein
LIKQFVDRVGHTLDYCGMPAVEFLDVDAWRPSLRSVVAVEYDRNVANDMRIERDRRQYSFPIDVIDGEICRILADNQRPFDLYNLDFYTGFVNVRKGSGAICVDALRALFNVQRRHHRSFILIVTFNVRDLGAKEYVKFLDAARNELASTPNGEACIAAHTCNQASRLKVCFPFFCWQQAHSMGFEQETENVYVYRTSATMVHFHQRFIFERDDILRVPALGALIDIANRPLFEMKGQVPHRRLVPPRITRLST